MIRCPTCGQSHYIESTSDITAMYFPPVWKNGVNINPDRNIVRTECKCLECQHLFTIIARGDEVVLRAGPKYKPDPAPILANCTVEKMVPIENSMSTAIATIDIDTHEPVRTQYTWEVEIEELKKQVDKLTKMVESLWKWNTHDVLEEEV